MSMIEIDPHLFIKCRLCLEESGIYQIVPAIGEQISFCFGINVEPFDGLPQLICKKCQLVLSDYSKTKHNFIQKQEDLMKRNTEKDLKTTALDRSKNHKASKRRHENNDEDKAYTKFKRRRLLSSSSEKSNESNSNCAVEDFRSIANEDENTKWKAKYQKTFTCTFCNFTSFTRKSINSHQVIHKALKLKHVNNFNKYCSVKMPRIFDKLNLTGTTDHVVYSKKKIIAKNTTLTADYCVVYKYKDSMPDENFKREEQDNADAFSDSSFKSNKKVRRMRVRQLTSRSSTETVLLENDANVCISIDDSDSSDGKDETNEKRKPPEKTNHIVIKETTNMINKLITVSYNKYAKRHEILDKSTLQQLNRKIVSIGRQIINKRGFNTNRLMKYMEHLNLNIIWLARSPLSVTNSTNYFKIIPRTRYSNEKSINDFEGYKKRYDKRNIQNRAKEATLDEERSGAESTEGRLDAEGRVETEMMAQMSDVDQDDNIPLIKQDNGQAEFDPVLLNENPVANPKQLKKLLGEAKKNNIESNVMPTLEVNLDDVSWEVMTHHENNMPVITLTRSLASTNTSEDSNNDNTKKSNTIANNENTNPDPLKTAPRIKVKSVSELMSKETLSRMNEPAPVLSPNQLLNGGAQYAVSPLEKTSVSSTASTSDDFVLLDTVELPNTTTNSPFNYLKILMEMHNLFLLDTSAVLTPDFHSIIRFRVRYNQENQGTIVLHLSLLCLNNTICLKVRDRFNRCNIEMTKISANWQWEILKIYKGDVVPKLLENAEKTGPEVFNNVNRFICLLKSINNITK